MEKKRESQKTAAREEAEREREAQAREEQEDAPPKEDRATGRFESSAPKPPITTEHPAAKAQATTLTEAPVNPDTLVPINTNPSPRGSNPNLGTNVRTPGNAAFVTRNPPSAVPAVPNPQGDLSTVQLDEEPDEDAKKLMAKREALQAQDEEDAGKIKDEDGFLLPLEEQLASGAKTVITNLSGEVFINGRRYGPGRNVSVPAEAYAVWKTAIDFAQNDADQTAFKAQREGAKAAPLTNETPAGELEARRMENRQATEIDGITRSIT